MKPIDTAKLNNFLFIMMGGIGNMILLTPAIRALRDKFPGCKIGLLVGPYGAAKVFEGSSWIDQVFYLLPNEKSPFKIFSLIRKIRKFKPDACFTATGGNPFKSSLFGLLGGSKIRIGEDISDKTNFYTHPIEYNFNEHEVDGNIRLVEPLNVKVEKPELFFSITQKDMEEATKSLQSVDINPGDPYIAVHPGAGDRSLGRLWDAENFGAVAKHVSNKHKVKIVVVGGPTEVDLAEKVVCSAETGVVLAGKLSLGATASVLQNAKLLLTNDSGVMHIASAVGTKTVVIWGYTVHWKTKPYGDHHVLIRKDLPCSPCYPYVGNPKNKIDCCGECMTNISVDEVIDIMDKQF